jgi:polyisoprenoid-binding protein YceI
MICNLPAGLLVLALIAAPAWAQAAGRDYRFDTVHTQVLFRVSHLGFSNSTGRLHVKSGFFHFDDADWSQAKLDVTIDIASLDMGDAVWNEKLRSHEFFASERYPSARFIASGIDKVADKRAIVHGKLSLLGRTRPVDLAVTFNRAGVDAYTFKWTAGFSATAQLKRSDFGMVKYLPDVGDAVELRIEAEGIADDHAQTPSGPAESNAIPAGTPAPEH